MDLSDEQSTSYRREGLGRTAEEIQQTVQIKYQLLRMEIGLFSRQEGAGERHDGLGSVASQETVAEARRQGSQPEVENQLRQRNKNRHVERHKQN